jgi:magnesium transporter
MLNVRHIVDGEVRAVPAEEALALAQGTPSGVVWVDLVGQGDDVRTFLADLPLEEWVAEDMLQTSTYPKAEAWPGLLFLVVSGLDLDPDGDVFQLETMELDAVMGEHWLLTHADEHLELVERSAALLERESVGAVSTPGQLLHLLLDSMVDEYEPFIDVFIPQRLETIEEALFTNNAGPEIRQEIYLRRRDVQRLQRVARPEMAAVRRLSALVDEAGTGEAHLFRDIADRLDYVASQTELLRGQLDAAFDHFQSQAAHNQNEIMKVLTMVSTTLLPITVLAGIWGMNFEHMPEIPKPWGYPAALGSMALVVLISFVFFRSRGWIGRREKPDFRPGQLQMTVDRVLRTPAVGARVVGRTAGAVGRGAGKVTRKAGRLIGGRSPR